MNALDEAAELLENGWCTGDLREHDNDGQFTDKFCAVGALAHVTGEMNYYNDSLGYEHVDDVKTYHSVRRLPETKALADEIMESDWQKRSDYASFLVANYENGCYEEVLFNFNDRQDDKYAVIDMFKLASKRLDAGE